MSYIGVEGELFDWAVALLCLIFASYVLLHFSRNNNPFKFWVVGSSFLFFMVLTISRLSGSQTLQGIAWLGMPVLLGIYLSVTGLRKWRKSVALRKQSNRADVSER